MTLELTDQGIIESGNMSVTPWQSLSYMTGQNQACGSQLSQPAHVYNNSSGYMQCWNSYPLYICTDKTAKAIQVLKQLEADKVIKLTSVKSFIEMVEKIVGIL